MLYSATTIGAGTGFAVDGVMLEECVSSTTETSPYSPMGVTTITGSAITTGKISNAAGTVYFDLDNSKIYSSAAGGITIEGAGGITVVDGGNIKLNSGGDVLLYSESTGNYPYVGFYGDNVAKGSMTCQYVGGVGWVFGLDGASDRMQIVSDGQLDLFSNDGRLRLGAVAGDFVVTYNDFRPSADATYDCGYDADHNSGTGSGNDRYWHSVWSMQYYTGSSREKKSEILDTALGLDFILSLQPKQYKYKNTVQTEDRPGRASEKKKRVEIRSDHTHTHYGLVAEELQKTLKDLGITEEQFGALKVDKDGKPKAINYNEFVAPLIKSVHELEARLSKIEGKGKKP
jgi:hypothetical protein